MEHAPSIKRHKTTRDSKHVQRSDYKATHTYHKDTQGNFKGKHLPQRHEYNHKWTYTATERQINYKGTHKETQIKFRGTHATTKKHKTTTKLQTSTIKIHKMATESLVEFLSLWVCCCLKRVLGAVKMSVPRVLLSYNQSMLMNPQSSSTQFLSTCVSGMCQRGQIEVSERELNGTCNSTCAYKSYFGPPKQGCSRIDNCKTKDTGWKRFFSQCVPCICDCALSCRESLPRRTSKSK